MNGYILESRQILESEIWKKPPIYFKVWHYLLLNAQYRDTGHLKRGQLFTTINDLRDACKYKVGYRVEKPSVKEVRDVLNWLRNPDEGNNEGHTKGSMIVTTKVTHGMVVTICNYNVYQTPDFYEGHNEGNNEGRTKVTTKVREGAQYYKEYKELKNNNNNLFKEKEKEKEKESDDVLHIQRLTGEEAQVMKEESHKLFLERMGK